MNIINRVKIKAHDSMLFTQVRYFCFYALLLSTLNFQLSSCTSYKQLQYLQGSIDSVKYSNFKVPEQKAQKGDQISITVFSENAAASALYNGASLATGVGVSANNNQQGAMNMNTAGGAHYEVDKNGDIFFPKLGLMHVEGLTREGIKGLLDTRLKDTLLVNPYYEVKFTNLKFTVFGEVASPGVFPLEKNNLNIFEALTAAGDLTFYGKRENILVIRENNGKREFGRINLLSTDVFNSPYYYLQQNDMVMVDMRKQKAAGQDQTYLRNISVYMSLLTGISLLINLFK